MHASWGSIPEAPVVLRHRGPRDLADIAPAEVMAALDALDDGTEDLYRRLANKWNLGGPRLDAKRYPKRCDARRSQ